MTVPSRPDRWGRIPRSVTVVADTFPRQYARTQRLTLGDPRDVSVSSDGRRIIFLRSRAGDDPVNCLWVADANKTVPGIKPVPGGVTIWLRRSSRPSPASGAGVGMLPISYGSWTRWQRNATGPG